MRHLRSALSLSRAVPPMPMVRLPCSAMVQTEQVQALLTAVLQTCSAAKQLPTMTIGWAAVAEKQTNLPTGWYLPMSAILMLRKVRLMQVSRLLQLLRSCLGMKVVMLRASSDAQPLQRLTVGASSLMILPWQQEQPLLVQLWLWRAFRLQQFQLRMPHSSVEVGTKSAARMLLMRFSAAQRTPLVFLAASSRQLPLRLPLLRFLLRTAVQRQVRVILLHFLVLQHQAQLTHLICLVAQVMLRTFLADWQMAVMPPISLAAHRLLLQSLSLSVAQQHHRQLVQP
mmetsp:Transcript_12898/g.45736  ORF Transcript_12898/g.45736 Transcript_12898/m.45736 type:complete len:284 (+) Transcript_12898:2931-3782(+)